MTTGRFRSRTNDLKARAVRRNVKGIQKGKAGDGHTPLTPHPFPDVEPEGTRGRNLF